jgi:hypothetical protein
VFRVFLALVFLLWVPVGSALAGVPDAYPRDLHEDEWAYGAARDLAERGILSGFPDGTFRAHAPVDRLTLARALARTIDHLEAETPAKDLELLARLTKEFAHELKELGLKTRAQGEQLELHREQIAGLKTKVDTLAGRVREQERFYFNSGELRVLALNNQSLQSQANLIINFNYRISERITGVFSPQFIDVFNRRNDSELGVWEAYADFADFGIIQNVRVGRQKILMGDGLTLFNRQEGFNLTTRYSDLFFQVLYAGNLMALVEANTSFGLDCGFYFIQEAQNSFNESPTHVGTYVKGNLGSRVTVGFEFASYSDSAGDIGIASSNRQGYLAEARWDATPGLQLRGCVIVEGQDFRALSIDRDLIYHSPVKSPLEDVLNALSFATLLDPLPVNRNEINGFVDYKSGLDVRLPHSPFVLGLNWDCVRDYSYDGSNLANQFNLYIATLRRPISDTSWLELRGRFLAFDNPSTAPPVGTLDVSRVDRSDFRIQWFGTF